MIVDSSALIAVLRQEADASMFTEALASVKYRYLSAPGYLETCMVHVGRKGAEAQVDVDELLRDARIQILPFRSEHANVAVSAFVKFGKGRGHRAQLNFGDCISYAVSKVEAMPLLFKGDDFRLTDVECALPAAG